MNQKIRLWLESKGRRLAELRAMGGKEYFKKKQDKSKLNQLDGQDWIEFFTLTGEFNALLWAYAPKNNTEAFLKEINQTLLNLEKQNLQIRTTIGKNLLVRSDSTWEN